MTDVAPNKKSKALAIPLDPGRGEPLYRQIADYVWNEVLNGTLDTGDRLPTVRQLAVDLGIHPGTVNRAYDELERLGVIVRRPGEGTFVGAQAADRANLKRYAALEQYCRDVVAEAESRGFTVDEVIDMVGELRNQARDGQPPTEA
jgi:GntR family transcriptional regulator